MQCQQFTAVVCFKPQGGATNSGQGTVLMYDRVGSQQNVAHDRQTNSQHGWSLLGLPWRADLCFTKPSTTSLWTGSAPRTNAQELFKKAQIIRFWAFLSSSWTIHFLYYHCHGHGLVAPDSRPFQAPVPTALAKKVDNTLGQLYQMTYRDFVGQAPQKQAGKCATHT